MKYANFTIDRNCDVIFPSKRKKFLEVGMSGSEISLNKVTFFSVKKC